MIHILLLPQTTSSYFPVSLCVFFHPFSVCEMIMKTLTASVVVGGGGLNLSGNRQFISFNHFSPLNLRPRSQISGNLSNQEYQFLERNKSNLKFKLVITRAADSSPAGVTGGNSIVEDNEFSLAKISFGVIGLGLGLSLLSYGFGAYFNILPGSEWSAIMLTYGFPLTIIGMALQYAELKPVPCLTYAEAQALREKCATPILKQVRDDVIRFRYGDEQHLEEALKRIFQYGLGGGVARRNAPILQKIREEVTEGGKYCLVLVFEAKALELADFEKRQAKFASFFGPGITAEVGKGEEENMYDVRLISETTL